MKQLQAGYFIEGIKKLYGNKQAENRLNPLLKQLSYFDIETDTDISQKIQSPEIAVINNIITRGNPTRPSIFIEDMISKVFSQTIKNVNDRGNIEYDFIPNVNKDLINRALHIIDPRIKKKYPEKQYNKQEKFRTDFIFNISKQIGDYFLHRIKLSEQKNKFTVELPYIDKNKKGIVIQTDADKDITKTDYLFIERKKAEWKNKNFDFLYVKKGKIENAIQELQYFTYREYFDIIKKNFQVPLYNRNSGIDILQIALTPFAIARIQKTFIEFMISDKIKTNTKLKIAVIERDVPASFLAFEDLKRQFENLFILQNKKSFFPKIELDIYYTEEFKNAKLNEIFKGNKKNINQFDKNKFYDLLIDISMLQKTGFDNKIPETKAKNKVKIRSVRSVNSNQKFFTDKLIIYKALKPDANNPKNKIENSLKFFLQNIFRKENFYEDQITAIKKALTLENFVQITPPGNGKTLIYQFSAFLQAGISIAVLPNISMLKEHCNELKNENINGTCYINSSKNKTKIEIEKFSKGKSLITFVNSEKFKEASFKKIIDNLISNKIYFAYFIIDEIQCISEFSSDFKSDYTSIVNFAENNCKTKNIRKIPLMGLSAVATYNVKTDIVKTLNLKPENFIISKKDKRKINYKIIETNEKYETILKLLEKIKLEKNDTLIVDYNIEGIYEIINNQEDTNITQEIKKEFPTLKTESYFGTIDEVRNSVEIDEVIRSERNYLNFKNRKINILTADESSCNFNKSNIRNIIFMNFPESPEKFYKMSGRAGRDGKPANVYVLYNDTITEVFENIYTIKTDGKPEPAELILNITPDSIMQRQKLTKKYKNRKKSISALNEITKEIKKITDKLKINQKDETELTFSNNVANETFEMFEKYLSGKFTKKNIEKAYNSNNYHTDFINELNEISKTKLVNYEIDIDAELEKMFYNYRNRKDTEIALYRLKTMGYIENYEIDFDKECFKIYLIKKTENKYIENLYNYVKKYSVEQNFQEFKNKIKQQTGNKTTEKCTSYLTNYVYDNIVSEKYKEIEYMDKFCSVLSVDKSNNKEINQKTENFLDSIFYSKYTNQIIRPNLEMESDNYKQENFHTVLKFIRKAGNSLSNREHLYESTEKALQKNSENFTSLLLNAYARFWKKNEKTEKNENDNSDFERLTKGFLLMEQKENLNFEQNFDRKNDFLKKLYGKDQKLQADIEPVFFLKTHTNWLIEFNKKFL